MCLKVGVLVFGFSMMGCGGSATDAGGEAALFIRQVQASQRPSGGVDCTTPLSPDSQSYPQGTLDLALATSYHANLLVGNSSAERVQLTGSTVRLEDAAGMIVSGPY